MGVNLTLTMNQAFVWPDRALVELDIASNLQMFLSQGNTEYQYNPGAGHLIEVVYLNLSKADHNPMMARQLSMAFWSELLPQLKTAREAPQPSLDEIVRRNTARINETAPERARLKGERGARDVQRLNELAGEAARLRDEIDQVEIQKKYPCKLIEVDNGELVQHLTTNRLIGPSAARYLTKGKTRFLVTRAHGLPIRMESRTETGYVVLYLCLRQVRINQGLNPGDVSLGTRPGTTRVTLTADLAQADWSDRLELELSRRLSLLETRRRQQAQPQR